MPLLRVEVTDGCVERLIRCEYSAVLLFTPLSGISVFAYALAQCELVPGGDFSFWLRMELEEPGSRMMALRASSASFGFASAPSGFCWTRASLLTGMFPFQAANGSVPRHDSQRRDVWCATRYKNQAMRCRVDRLAFKELYAHKVRYHPWRCWGRVAEKARDGLTIDYVNRPPTNVSWRCARRACHKA